MRNVTSLGSLISWQKVDYDFSYHQMEFPCDVNVLVVSEGRSLLPVREPGRRSRPSVPRLQPARRSVEKRPRNVACAIPGSRCHRLPWRQLRGERTVMSKVGRSPVLRRPERRRRPLQESEPVSAAPRSSWRLLVRI